jgi:hypothetical protein
LESTFPGADDGYYRVDRSVAVGDVEPWETTASTMTIERHKDTTPSFASCVVAL